MALRIEDYAVIGNGETVALVGRDGSIDWLCLPRFDSSACFCALLGSPEHGRWLIAPAQNDIRITRRYFGDTLILETIFTTASGSASLIDFMYRRDGASELVRIVKGLQKIVVVGRRATINCLVAPGVGRNRARIFPWPRGRTLSTASRKSASDDLDPLQKSSFLSLQAVMCITLRILYRYRKRLARQI